MRISRMRRGIWGTDLQADRRAEVALVDDLLHRFHEIRRLILFDLEVRIPGDAERMNTGDLHAREQEVEIGGDDLLEPDEIDRIAGAETQALSRR